MKRVLKWSGAFVLLLLFTAATFGFVTQRQKDARIDAAHPAPGAMVDVGEHTLHYRLRGAGTVTFVLEAGLGDYSGSWGELDSLLADHGRVFVYDRAGYGWSEVGPQPRTAQQITAELHRALSAADIAGPYILVGHSYGGALHTLFAMEHPEDVAGMLLIDPSHRDQLDSLPQPPLLERLIGTQLPRAAAFGLPGMLFNSPDPVANTTAHIATFGAELRAAPASVEAWRSQPLDLGDTPLIVLTAGDYEQWPGESAAEQKATWEIWRSLHASLVASSSSVFRRHVVVDGAGHYIHHDDPEAVLDAALELIRFIRTGSPPSDSRATRATQAPSQPRL